MRGRKQRKGKKVKGRTKGWHGRVGEKGGGKDGSPWAELAGEVSKGTAGTAETKTSKTNTLAFKSKQ
jgi:hypothetical protein